MAVEDEAAAERLAYLQQRQELLASAVTRAQAAFYATILDSIDKITSNPAVLDALFYQVTRNQFAGLVSTFAADVVSIGRVNATYFETITGKDYGAIKKDIQSSLLKRFGLKESGELAKDGFFDLFLRDTSIQQKVKQTAYQLQYSGAGVKEFTQTLSTIIQGNQDTSGAYEKFFKQWAFDTYQLADAEIQEQYAKKLELPAALYSGGTVRDTRPFCRERNGQVWLRNEILAWDDLDWAGKMKGTPVLLARGGYGCRHSYSWITEKMAVRRDNTLSLNEKGVLVRNP